MMYKNCNKKKKEPKPYWNDWEILINSDEFNSNSCKERKEGQIDWLSQDFFSFDMASIIIINTEGAKYEWNYSNTISDLSVRAFPW